MSIWLCSFPARTGSLLSVTTSKLKISLFRKLAIPSTLFQSSTPTFSASIVHSYMLIWLSNFHVFEKTRNLEKMLDNVLNVNDNSKGKYKSISWLENDPLIVLIVWHCLSLLVSAKITEIKAFYSKDTLLLQCILLLNFETIWNKMFGSVSTMVNNYYCILKRKKNK